MSQHAALIAQRLARSLTAIESIRRESSVVSNAIDAVLNSLRDGGTLYTAGNGGSAAQALHLAEELIGRYRGNRPPQRAICLNADPTALTCIANDFGFEHVFSRQCEALLTPRDVLVVFSTSGNSPNIINALTTARQREATTIGLLGNDGGKCAALCDHAIRIHGEDSSIIQDAHQIVIHLFCEAVEREHLPQR